MHTRISFKGKYGGEKEARTMPTQLESIIHALEQSGRPMAASELADVIVKNGSKAERPENTVLSLVHRCRDIVNVGGSPAMYALRSAIFGPEACQEGNRDAGFLEAFCAKMAKAARACANEADVREKMVVPMLRDYLRYDVVTDMQFERPINSEKGEIPDIVVVNGKKRLFFVEIKKIGSDLSKAEGQLKRYFKMMDRPPVRFGILTDGIRWNFYLRRLRSGIPEAVPFASGSVSDGVSFGFLDALDQMERGNFNADTLEEYALNLVGMAKTRSTGA